jgi:Fur family transcriptional regulator, ferric uptake regulator
MIAHATWLQQGTRRRKIPIPMKATYLDHLDCSESAIRKTGERLTQPRVIVLACLLASARAVTHLDVANTLARAAQHAVDRVTVYRVLEWLVSQGVAHRISGDDRVWRFMLTSQTTAMPAAPHGSHGHHPHFTCDACGQTICLDKTIPKVNVKLPKGFRTSEIDLLVRGRCAGCTTA